MGKNTWAGLPPQKPVKPPRISTWTGALKGGPRLVFMILLLGIPTLILAASTIRELANAPVDVSKQGHPTRPWPNSKILPLYLPLPTATVADTILTLLLHHNVLLSPLYAVATSTLLLLGWIVQLYLWTTCDLLSSHPSPHSFAATHCPQRPLILDSSTGTAATGWNGYVGVTRGVTGARIGFGVGCAVGYAGWMAFACVAARRFRKQPEQRESLNIVRSLSPGFLGGDGDEQEVGHMYAA